MGLHAECVGNGLEHPKADLLAPKFEVTDVVLVHPGLFGKIDLPPMPLQAQLAYAFPERDADVPCHPYYRGDNVGGTSTLSYGRVSNRRRPRERFRRDAMHGQDGSRLLMGQKKRNKVSWKRVGSTLSDSRMNAEGSSRFYQRQKLPLSEALALASPVIRRSTNTRALAKPSDEVRVVSAAIPQPKLNSPSPSKRAKPPGTGENIRVLCQDAPGLGLPWVPGPLKRRKPKAQPKNAKAKTATPRKKDGTPAVGAAPRTILLHEGQPRFEGGIRFVQGGLPYLGKR